MGNQVKKFGKDILLLIQTYPYKSSAIIGASGVFGYLVRWIFE